MRTLDLSRNVRARAGREAPMNFFFQAEDGIRDLTVTGVQTCALPIWGRGPYSLKRRGCDAVAAAAAGFRRATPTTPRTVTSESAARGTKMRSVEEFKSGEVTCKPLSSSASKSLGTTPSKVSPSL